MFDGFVVMSGGHCTHPTGGPAIRLKHKKNLPERGFGCKSQTLHSKPFFLLGDVPFGVWPGPFLFIFGVWFHFFIFWSVVRSLL